MNWTEELPAKTGFYWHRRDASDNFPQVVRVTNRMAFETCYCRFGESGHWPVAELGGEWCKIKPPKD